ncbi:3723_t:CDS:1 [Acaulospora colombiana]|uniref:3723_t:CDS:1 n=1 Tax=Acaulospora colombiana TaxID=27376 RepID=A0ACA9M155_9GLOM|nr:3723_t:CDS:1 [Acaulospora colombiana]
MARYIYSGVLNLTGVSNFDILDLLVASDELLLSELTEHVQNHLIEHTDSWLEQNFIKVLHTIFRLVSCKELKDHCLKSICDNPKPFFDSEDFLSLDKDIFLELIKCDELIIEEADIWEHLIKWGIYQTPEIEGMKSSDVKNFSDKNFKDLKKTMNPFILYVRFYEISSKDFFNKVRPFQKVLPESIFEDTMSFLMAKTEPKQEILPARTSAIIKDSKILSRRHANIISNWIEKRDAFETMNKEKQHHFALLYRGTRDGFDDDSFRQKVNGQGQAIVVIKVKDSGNIIGGFNANGWNGDVSNLCNCNYDYNLTMQHEYYDEYSEWNDSGFYRSHEYDCNSWSNNSDHFVFYLGGQNNFGTIRIGRSDGSCGVCDQEDVMIRFGNGDLILNSDQNGTCDKYSYDQHILDTNSFIAEELEVFSVAKNKNQ